jgi:hypothetical protein
MKTQYENLIKQIKTMMNSDYDIWRISLTERRIHGREDEKVEAVCFSEDNTKIICRLYFKDTLEEMADKIMKAESMMDEALKYKRYKEESPYLAEALLFNIPELSKYNH